MQNLPPEPPLPINPEQGPKKPRGTGESPPGSARTKGLGPRLGRGRPGLGHGPVPEGPALDEQRKAWRRARHQARAAKEARRPDGRFTRVPGVNSTRAMKKLLQLKSVQALDTSTPVAKALTYWQRELIAHLGGEAAVSAPQRLLIEDAARTTIYLGHVDFYLLDQAASSRSSLIRKRLRAMSQVAPLVLERMRIADHLTKVLTTLGLERRAPKPVELGQYLAENYGERDSAVPPGPGRGARPVSGGGITLPGIAAQGAAVEVKVIPQPPWMGAAKLPPPTLRSTTSVLSHRYFRRHPPVVPGGFPAHPGSPHPHRLVPPPRWAHGDRPYAPPPGARRRHPGPTRAYRARRHPRTHQAGACSHACVGTRAAHRPTPAPTGLRAVGTCQPWSRRMNASPGRTSSHRNNAQRRR